MQTPAARTQAQYHKMFAGGSTYARGGTAIDESSTAISTDSLGFGPTWLLLHCAPVHVSVEILTSCSSPLAKRRNFPLQEFTVNRPSKSRHRASCTKCLASQLLVALHAGGSVDVNLKACALKTSLPHLLPWNHHQCATGNILFCLVPLAGFI